MLGKRGRESEVFRGDPADPIRKAPRPSPTSASSGAVLCDLAPRLAGVLKQQQRPARCVLALAAVCGRLREELHGLREWCLCRTSKGMCVRFNGPDSTWDVSPDRLRSARHIEVGMWEGASLDELPFGVGDPKLLRYVRHVSLWMCPNLADVSALKRIRRLVSVDLFGCPRLSDLGPLEGVPRVVVENCSSVTDIAPLSKAKHVCLASIDVDSVDALSGVPDVSLSRLPGIRDVRPLAKAHRVHLEWMRSLTDVKPLVSAYSLSLHECRSLRALPFLGKVHTVDLGGLDNLRLNPATLQGVHTVRLSRLRISKSLAPLNRAARVELVCIDNKLDASELRDVPEKKFTMCSNVVNVCSSDRSPSSG